MVAPLLAVIIALGFYPKPLLDVINPAVARTMHQVGVTDPRPLTPAAEAPSSEGAGKCTAAAFHTPSIEYRQLLPILIVLRRGAGRRAGRGLHGPPVPARDPAGARPGRPGRGVRRGRGRRRATTRSSPRARSPSTVRRLFLQGTILLLAIPGILADRRALAGHRRPVRPGRLGDAGVAARTAAHRHRRDPDRGLPAADVRGRRDAAVPRRRTTCSRCSWRSRSCRCRSTCCAGWPAAAGCSARRRR